MDGNPNVPLPPPINPDTTSSSSSSSFSSSSPQDFIRHVQAAFKRHRPVGTMQSNNIRPKRMLAPQRKASGNSTLNIGPNTDMKKSEDLSLSQGQLEKDSLSHRQKPASVVGKGQEDASITPPSISGTCTNTFDEGGMTNCKDSIIVPSLKVESQSVDGQKKVQFSIGSNTAVQEMEWVGSNRLETSIGFSQDSKHQSIQQAESEINLRSEGGKSSLLPKRTTVTQDHLQQFRNFLSQPATQSSVAGPSHATTTSVHLTSAPMLNSTTFYSHSHLDSGSHGAAEPLGDLNFEPHPIAEAVIKPSGNSLKDKNGMSDQAAIAVQTSNSPIDEELTFKESHPSREQGCMLKETSISKYNSCHDYKSTKGKESGDVTNVQPQAPMPKTSSSVVKVESSKLEKREKAASCKGSTAARKRTYDPDMFFKVNGKVYQRLGKIGSGGSSEVHKVISSDCTIYALKKIKLKGRDYATAYGFCQEIEYLNRLRGKNNIIQLIDYEASNESDMYLG